MECFVVYRNEIEGRIDPFYYKPEFREFEKLTKVLRVKKLGKIADFQYGLNEIAQKKGNIIYIRITDIDENGLLKKDSLAYLNYQDKFKKYKLKKGDILIARIGATFGKSYYFNEDFDAVFAGYLIRIKLKDDPITSKYLFYFFQTKYFWQQANKLVKGGAQPQFNANTLRELIIPIPDDKTHDRIVQIMDNAYKKKKQKEAEAQQLLDSINDYVLSKLGIELPELRDQMAFVVYADDVKGGRIYPYYYQPKFEEVIKAVENGKYEIKKLSEVAEKLVSGQRPKGGVRQINEGIPSIGGEHILEDGTVSTTELKYIPLEFHKKQLKSKIEKKDVLIVKDGATTGKIGIIPDEYPFEEANINEHVFLIRVKKDYDPYYVFSVLRSTIGQMQINRNITGGTIMGITKEVAESIKIPVPPLEIQNKIAEEVKRRMKKAEQLQEEAKEILEKAKQEVENIILNSENNEG